MVDGDAVLDSATLPGLGQGPSAASMLSLAQPGGCLGVSDAGGRL